MWKTLVTNVKSLCHIGDKVNNLIDFLNFWIVLGQKEGLFEEIFSYILQKNVVFILK